jgi:lantibiotic biosynthesis protein
MKALAHQYQQKIHSIITQSRVKNNSLLGGKLGLVLYNYNLYKAFKNIIYANNAITLIQEIIYDIATEKIGLSTISYCNGTAGLGYVINTLQKDGLIDTDVNYLLESIDENLFNKALLQIENNEVDFLHGAMGIVFYFLQKLPNEKIEQYLNILIRAFCKTAIDEKEGIWFKNYVKDKADLGQINLSLSHGLSGFLLILIQAAEKGICRELIKDTVKKGVNFILPLKKDIDIVKEDYTQFPSTLLANNTSSLFFTKRLAWCYGDLNIAYLLIEAGALLANEYWIKLGNIIGTTTCMRKTLQHVGATDSQVCHGTAGLAQFYKKLYNLTEIDEYNKAYHLWINKTLDLVENELHKGAYVENETNLLEGLVGVNLVLLSYLYNEDVTWNKALLL